MPMRQSLLNPRSVAWNTDDKSEGTKEARVTVLIPTYRRPTALANCVHSLLDGASRPAEIIVIGRKGDAETEQELPRLGSRFGSTVNLRSAWVAEPGHLPPVETGIRAARNGIVAMLDDDVTVAADWLAHILAPFSDSTVGVVGGRVLVPGSEQTRLKGKPGRSSWYGKHWGNVAHMTGESPIDV